MAWYFIRMERRTLAATVAETVTETMAERRVSVTTLSEATDIASVTLRERLSNESEFTFGELGDVGGFFNLPVSHFLKGTPA